MTAQITTHSFDEFDMSYRPSSLVFSDSFIWFIAILLSLTTHAVILFYKNNQHKMAPAMVTQETITHVRFATVSPPPVTVVEPPIIPEVIPPKPEPVIVPPKVEKKIIKKKKPVKKKIIKKKPTPNPKPKQKKVTVEKPQLKTQTTALDTRPQVNKVIRPSPIVSSADIRLLAQTRKSYFALIMRHIEVHKHYPRVARKRKIEGKINVSFSLLANGQIKNLLINGKRSILLKATKNAIENAQPMPLPPKDLSLPMTIKFTMNYFLK